MVFRGAGLSGRGSFGRGFRGVFRGAVTRPRRPAATVTLLLSVSLSLCATGTHWHWHWHWHWRWHRHRRPLGLPWASIRSSTSATVSSVESCAERSGSTSAAW